MVEHTYQLNRGGNFLGNLNNISCYHIRISKNHYEIQNYLKDMVKRLLLKLKRKKKLYLHPKNVFFLFFP